jgi:mitogen-activated protein kinase kinase kinase
LHHNLDSSIRQGLLGNTTTTNDSKHEGFNITTEKISKSASETSSGAKSLLNRSNSFSRFLGRSDSKRSQRTAGQQQQQQQQGNASVSNLSSSQQQQQQHQQNSDLYSLSPSSPRTLQKVKRKCKEKEKKKALSKH